MKKESAKKESGRFYNYFFVFSEKIAIVPRILPINNSPSMNRIFEKSSGGIVYRKQKGKIEVLLLEWENAKGEKEFVIPKGKMENAETAKDTALREIHEETWLPLEDLEVIKFMSKVNYSFIARYRDDSPMVDKDVYLFLVKYHGTSEPIIEKERRFHGFRWFTIEELKNTYTKPDIYGFIKKNIQYM